MSITNVFESYERVRQKNEQEQQRRRLEVYAKLPQLEDIYCRINTLLAERLRHAITGEPSDQSELKALSIKAAKLLIDNGFNEKYLDPIYSCNACRDTGILPDAKHCTCFKKKLLEYKLDTARLTDDSISFEQFRPELFDSTPIENGKSQRDYMLKYKAVFEQYADSFPHWPQGISTLILFGNTGLGKTYCAKCIMRRVIERGHTAALYTAYRLFSVFHAHRLGEDVDLDPFFEVPLLIIDDLGTEPMTKNVTIEYFFDLLNERLSSGKHTIIATNLKLDDLNIRYGERIYSRLADARFSLKIEFKGKDRRTVLAANSGHNDRKSNSFGGNHETQ